ncbi:MAG: hypothetical protein ACRDSR_13690 [Pseudonocardiaceae bacterium]
MPWPVATSARPTGHRCPTCQVLATSVLQFGGSPDSGRPPAETAPGGRPDTTAPVESVDLAAGCG